MNPTRKRSTAPSGVYLVGLTNTTRNLALILVVLSLDSWLELQLGTTTLYRQCDRWYPSVMIGESQYGRPVRNRFMFTCDHSISTVRLRGRVVSGHWAPGEQIQPTHGETGNATQWWLLQKRLGRRLND